MCRQMVSVVGMIAHKKTVPFEPNNTAEVLRAYRAREIQALGLEKAERFKKELKSTLNIPTTDESDTMSVQSDEIIEKVTPSWTRKTSLITV